MNVRVYVSIGSNIDRERSIRAGVRELAQRFGPLTLSPVYESEAVGFDGENFYNLAAGFDTGLPVERVAAVLREIEDRHGRDRSGPRFSSRTLDIDLLTYDDLVREGDGLQLPRAEIIENAFVLRPLADIAGAERHPRLGRSYAELWEGFELGGQRLWAVAFEFWL